MPSDSSMAAIDWQLRPNLLGIILSSPKFGPPEGRKIVIRKGHSH